MRESRIPFSETSSVSSDTLLFLREANDIERVQMGAPLMAAEKIQAIPGVLTTWINELLKKYVLEEDTLTEHMDWDTFRGKPFQNVASLAYMCWYTESRKAVTVTDLRKWLEKSEGVGPSSMSRDDSVDILARRRVQEEDGNGPIVDDSNLDKLQECRL